MFKVNDFFCGAGGLGLGFKLENFEIVGAWDHDQAAIHSYRRNVGIHAQKAKIQELMGKDIPYAEVWSFGFPCTDLSVAGKKEGLQGKNSGMFFQVMRLLEEVRKKPKILLAENVKGLKKYIPVLKEEFNRRGYDLVYRVYDSKDWGVPQKRERYFVVGFPLGEEGFQFPHPPSNQVLLSSVLQDKVDDKYLMNNDIAKEIIAQAESRLDTLNGVHACLTPKRVNKRQQGRRARPNEEPMYTLTAQDWHGIIDARGVHKIVRLLTPREAARMQGFPDTYKLIVSDSHLYKQFGNAVTVPIAKGLARALHLYLSEMEIN